MDSVALLGSAGQGATTTKKTSTKDKQDIMGNIINIDFRIDFRIASLSQNRILLICSVWLDFWHKIFEDKVFKIFDIKLGIILKSSNNKNFALKFPKKSKSHFYEICTQIAHKHAKNAKSKSMQNQKNLTKRIQMPKPNQAQNHTQNQMQNHSQDIDSPTQQKKQNLKPCFKCLFTLIGINVAIAFGVYFAIDFGYGLSFFVAQVSAFLVVLSSFYAMKSRLKKHQTNATKDDEKQFQTTQNQHQTTQEDNDSQEQKSSPISRFILGVQLSFGLYRVLAYLVLAVGIILLMDFGYFCVLGYIAGVIVCLSSIVLFQLKGYK